MRRLAITAFLASVLTLGPDSALGQTGLPSMCVTSGDTIRRVLAEGRHVGMTVRGVVVSISAAGDTGVAEDVRKATQRSCLTLGQSASDPATPFGSEFDRYRISVSDAPANTSLAAIGVDSVTLSVVRADGSVVRKVVTWRFDADNLKFPELSISLPELSSVSPGEIVRISVPYKSAAGATNRNFYVVKTGAMIAEVCLVDFNGPSCPLEPVTSPTRLHMPAARTFGKLRVRFRQDRTLRTAQDAGFDSVAFRINGKTAYNYRKTPGDDASKEIGILLNELDNEPQGSLVEIEVAHGTTLTRRYVHLRKSAEPYGAGLLGPIGIWLPVGMFSTNLKSASDTAGMPFEPAPIGLALGGKRFLGDRANSYVGISIFGSTQGVPTRDLAGNATGGSTYKAASVGALIDLMDYLYVGYAWTRRFDDATQPDPVWVVGPGQEIIKILKFLKGK
jgi:hypothetical protein